jgi:hypothetical protein
MAVVAALADIDVAPGEFERRVGPHALHLLDGALEIEQRCDLDDAADGDDENEPTIRTIEFFSKIWCRLQNDMDSFLIQPAAT